MDVNKWKSIAVSDATDTHFKDVLPYTSRTPTFSARIAAGGGGGGGGGEMPSEVLGGGGSLTIDSDLP